MTDIKYIKGDATEPVAIEGYATVICHCCNAFGAWGRGFVIPLGLKYPKAKKEYMTLCATFQDSNEKRNELMGEVVLSEISKYLYVANIIGQYYYSTGQREFASHLDVKPEYMPTKDGRFINYDAIRRGFHQLVAMMNGVPFVAQMPRIGCGLAGGDWKTIEKILMEELCSKDIPVVVFDL